MNRKSLKLIILFPMALFNNVKGFKTTSSITFGGRIDSYNEQKCVVEYFKI